MHFSPIDTDGDTENENEKKRDEEHAEEGEKKSRARGTAAMDPETRHEVARKGGLAVSRNKQHMAEIGRKGGQAVSKNREHMARIGRKGGEASRRTRETEVAGPGGEMRPEPRIERGAAMGAESEKPGLTRKPPEPASGGEEGGEAV